MLSTFGKVQQNIGTHFYYTFAHLKCRFINIKLIYVIYININQYKMDKLENESWEEYAFRHELFEIIYADKDKQIIDYIHMPNPDKYCYPVYNICSYCYPLYNICSTFHLFIWKKIKIIKNKYSMMRQHDCTYQGFSYFGLSLLSKEDNELQKKLYTLYHFWVPKETAIFAARALKIYNRSVELTKIISETHNEELKELLSINRCPPPNTKEEKEYIQDKKEKKHIDNEKIKESKKETIELYQNYLKNKEIRLKIIKLEQEISNLHSELIK